MKTIADYPELIGQWHPTKNGNLIPHHIPSRSNKLIWWKCPVDSDHEWKTTPDHRTGRNQGCPFCSGRRTCKSNCLAIIYPELANQWHKDRNGTLTPSDVVPGSHRKVWWKCSVAEDHEWEATIKNRAMNGSGCPYCSRDKVCKSNCLTTTHPSLAVQWHPTKNGELTPFDIVSGSHQKIWWKCQVADDHEWCVSSNARTNKESNCSNCPYCTGNRVSKSNCLATTHPHLVSQWHIEKNGHITPQTITAGSIKKVWWLCPAGHEWRAKIYNRAGIRQSDCPVCNIISRGEKAIEEILKKANINYEPQYRLDGCRYKRPLAFDFGVFLDGKLKLIEFNGRQHYEPTSFSKNINPSDNLEEQKIKDAIKKKYCDDNNIPFLVIPYWKLREITEIVINFIEAA